MVRRIGFVEGMILLFILNLVIDKSIYFYFYSVYEILALMLFVCVDVQFYFIFEVNW